MDEREMNDEIEVVLTEKNYQRLESLRQWCEQAFGEPVTLSDVFNPILSAYLKSKLGESDDGEA
jgi:hypothetical protein